MGRFQKCVKYFGIMAISVLSVGSNAQVRQEEPITKERGGIVGQCIGSNNRDSGKIHLLASRSHVMTFVPGLQFSIYTHIVLSSLSVSLSLSPSGLYCFNILSFQFFIRFIHSMDNDGTLLSLSLPETWGCVVCGNRFNSKKALGGHMNQHPERPWRGLYPPPTGESSA